MNPERIGAYVRRLKFNSAIGNVEFEFQGEWMKLDKFMRYMGGGSRSRGIKRDLAKAQRDWFQRFKIKLVNGLLTEGSSINARFEEHSPNYTDGGPSIGIRKGIYLDALRNLRIIQKNYIVTLSYYPGDLHRKSRRGGLPLAGYALAFEHGKANQPPRPLWAPTFMIMGGGESMVKNLRGAISMRLSKMGI